MAPESPVGLLLATTLKLETTDSEADIAQFVDLLLSECCRDHSIPVHIMSFFRSSFSGTPYFTSLSESMITSFYRFVSPCTTVFFISGFVIVCVSSSELLEDFFHVWFSTKCYCLQNTENTSLANHTKTIKLNHQDNINAYLVSNVGQ